MSTPRTLRGDLPFRRLAVVLSGGGALGAYQVGVLSVLEAVGLRPAILAGVSSGALNAVSWMAHGFRTEPLRRVWENLGPQSLGLRWSTLAVRAGAGFVTALAALEVVLTLGSSRQLSAARFIWHRHSDQADVAAVLLEALAWAGVCAAGVVLLRLSRPLEAWMSRLTAPTDPAVLRRWWGRALLAGGLLQLVAWVLDLAWPHRFGLTILVLGGGLWLASRPGSRSGGIRRGFLRLLPETGGRGLWGTAARRRTLMRIVEGGDVQRLMDPAVHLVIGALDLGSGRVCQFVNWRDPDPGFERHVEEALGAVAYLREPGEVLEAALASSALPVIYEPLGIAGREFADPGGFSNQPLRVAIADGADALLVVLLSPVEDPGPAHGGSDLFELGARLIEIANWRDLQGELRALPPDWRGGGSPARVCVVEPGTRLAGGVLGFDPVNALELMARGERDAWAALERAGWLEPAGPAGTAGT